MHLKIGIGSNGGPEAYKRYKSLGFDCVDFSLAKTDSVWYTLPEEEAEELLLREKSWAADAGMELHQCHGPWMGEKHYSTPALRAERMAEDKRSLWCASVLGIKNWVIHPIFPFGGDEPNAEMRAESFKMNYDFYTELLETARKYNITICCENMPFTNFGLSEIDCIKELVDKIGNDHFKICLDTGHVNCFKTRDLGEAVRICGKDLHVLHVHDNKGWDSHDIPYFGNADWDSFYNGLTDIRYSGAFNFETCPNYRMGDRLFDEMLGMMVRIAKQIMRDDA